MDRSKTITQAHYEALHPTHLRWIAQRGNPLAVAAYEKINGHPVPVYQPSAYVLAARAQMPEAMKAVLAAGRSR